MRSNTMILGGVHRGWAWAVTVTTAVIIGCSGAAAASPSAHAAKSCKPPAYPGTGYFTSLSVTNTACGTGKKIALAYYKCRSRHGAKGRCTSKVLGYSCSEKRNSIPTEIDARVTCKKGDRKVVHTYQQDV
jgi:hypothetical protein